MKVQLSAHPAFPPRSVQAVDVEVDVSEPGGLRLRYSVRATGGLKLPELTAPERTDGLWQTTCFELFGKRDGGPGYNEFNFAPSSEWAAYAFDDYRSGMRDLDIPSPEIVLEHSRHVDMLVNVQLPEQLASGSITFGLSAVIEEADGTKSFWALRHPAEQPDFHHPEGFALVLPVPE